MKAEYIGYTDVDSNAMFRTPGFVKGNLVVTWKLFELKDGINADEFVIGEEYYIDGLVK